MLGAFYSHSGTETHSVPTAEAPAGDFLVCISCSPVPSSRVETKGLGYKPYMQCQHAETMALSACSLQHGRK